MAKYKISDICIINPKDKIDDVSIDVSFVPMQSISEHGDIDTSDIRKAAEVSKGFTSFVDGDVLMAKITPCMENGKGAVAKNLCNNRGFGSTEFLVLRPNHSIVRSQWIYYYTAQKQFRLKCKRNMTGSAGQKRVPKSYLENCEIEVPSLVEQDYALCMLDYAKKIVNMRRQQLEKLEELVKARFVEMFGNPEQNEKGWRTCRLGDECTVINGRAYKAEELLDEGKYRVLRVGNFFTNDSWYYSDLELDNDKYCDEGDLLFAWSASFGPRIWHGEKVIYHYHIWKLMGYGSCLNKDFFVELLNYNCDVMKRGTHGSTMLHFTKSQMEDQRLILPPMQLQEQFADFVHQVNKSKAAVQKALDEAQLLFDSLMQQYFG